MPRLAESPTPPLRPPQIRQHSPIPAPFRFPRALGRTLPLCVSVSGRSLSLSVCAVRVRSKKFTAETRAWKVRERPRGSVCVCVSFAGRRDVIAGWGIWSPGAIRRELGLEPFLGPWEPVWSHDALVWVNCFVWLSVIIVVCWEDFVEGQFLGECRCSCGWTEGYGKNFTHTDFWVCMRGYGVKIVYRILKSVVLRLSSVYNVGQMLNVCISFIGRWERRPHVHSLGFVTSFWFFHSTFL